MKEHHITKHHIKKNVSGRLRNRVYIYLLISVVIVAAIVYRLFEDGGDIWYALFAFALGLIVGILVSSMYKIWWDTDAQKVVSRLDTYGIVLLVLYIGFELFGEHVIRQHFGGPMVLTMILSLAGGAVLGRGIGIGGAMLQVLRENV